MDTRPEGLGVKGAEVNFRSLSLGGVRGKVRATLNETQISFESRSGHALDLRLDAIQRVHHHHTTLIPGWLAAVGVIFMWAAWRGFNGQFQAILGAIGIVLSAEGRNEEAIATLKEAIRIRPGFAAAQKNLKIAISKLEKGP